MLRRVVTACGTALAMAGTVKDTKMTFTVYSDPIELRYGQVYNTMQIAGGYDAHALPKEVVDRYAGGDVQMAITNFTVDMIRIAADGSETPVPLHDHYLHHYVINFGQGAALRELVEHAAKDGFLKRMLTGCHGMHGMGLVMFQDELERRGKDSELVSFGSAAGAEYRHNPQGFQMPYALVLKKPEAFLPTFHIINTKELECPCTPQRKIDPVNGLIDGKPPQPHFDCSPAFAATGNAACNLSTYIGGWRCCEHDVFVIDTDKECIFPRCWEKPVDRVFMKFIFEYEDAKPDVHPVEPGACCDTTASGQGFGNIEHDVPVCKDPSDCTLVTESVQPLAYFEDLSKPKPHRHAIGKNASALVDIVFVAPHLHWAGISMELMDAVTNKTICKVERPKGSTRGGVYYGSGKDAGNEQESRSVYNASEYHMGVMSLWLTTVAAVQATEVSWV